MKTFTEPLKELKEFETLSAGVHDLRGIAQISGCIDAAKPHIMYSVNNGSGNRIIVTFQEQRAKEIYEEYRFFDPVLPVGYPWKCAYRGAYQCIKNARGGVILHHNNYV